MTIAFFINSLGSGGIEMYLLRFLRRYHSFYRKIYIFCKSGRGGVLETEYSALQNVKIVPINLGFTNLRRFYKLRGLLKKEGIEIICDFTGDFGGIICFIAKNISIKQRIIWYRGSMNHFKEDPLRIIYSKFCRYLVKKYATAILSNSSYAFDNFFSPKWKYNKKMQVIYNGVEDVNFVEKTGDLRDELYIPRNSFVVGHVGRFDTSKNHELIIRVAKEFILRIPNSYFLLCGKGVKSNLEGLLISTHEKEHILLFENRTDIPKFLRTLNCFFFPSITEGQPNALIEAMMAGLPIIASDIPPIKETTPEEFHSFLIDPHNENGFHQTIKLAYSSKDFAKSLILKKWALEKFNAEKQFKKFYLKINGEL